MPLLHAHQLQFRYGAAGSTRAQSAGATPALKGVDLEVEQGAAVGIVGETGSGKSTLIRLLCGLLPATSGSVTYDARPVTEWLHTAPREFRRRNQLIFQSPANSFDPRMTIGRSLMEPIKALQRRNPDPNELHDALARVGLGPEIVTRYPHQLSGGQQQRVAIARALLPQPEILYADEPTSALDVSVQGHVLNLLMSLRAQLGLTLVMVSHDLAVVSRVCEQIVVMKNGEIVETGATTDIFRNPTSSYTRSLLAAAEAVSLTPAAQVKTDHQASERG